MSPYNRSTIKEVVTFWIWIWIDSQQKTSVKEYHADEVLREGGRGLGAGTLQLGQLWLKTGNGLSFCYAGW